MKGEVDTIMNWMMQKSLFPSIASKPQAEAIEALKKIAVKAASLRATRLDTEMLEITAVALYDELMKDWPSITLNEIEYAVHEGSFEKYGEVYGINAVTLYKMIVGYKNSPIYSEATRRFRHLEGKDKTQAFLNAHKPLYLKQSNN